MNSFGKQSADYYRIEKAIRYLGENAEDQPSLEKLASLVNLSPFHFQRLFTRWAGVSPKRFLQYLTAEEAKKHLRASVSVMEAAFEVGLSGPGRLHDLLVSVEAVTPGQYKEYGKGLTVRYGTHPTPFGDCFIAATDLGVCELGFVDEGRLAVAKEELARKWPWAEVVADDTVTGGIIDQIFAPGVTSRPGIRLLLKGTNLQIKVWRALLEIPEGTVVSYTDVATKAGNPKAVRAVASAVGKNPVAYLIPCHRVLRKTGEIGGYRWGMDRKKAMLAREWSGFE